MPPVELLSRNLLVRLSPGLEDRLTIHARGRGLSRSAVVRLAVEKLLAEDGAERVQDPNLPALAALVAAEHVRHLVESFLPDPERTTLEARATAVDAALRRLDELVERLERREP